jgi:2'-hydroxyisoflavone reductase
MQKLLILGGTNFIGRNLLEALLNKKEYHITLFNRGKTNPDTFPELNRITGDRNTADVNKLADEDWDYVIDLSCYYPDSLERILQVLQPSIKRYVFVSTCSVYDQAAQPTPGKDENAPLLACTAEERTDQSWDSYGQRKAECERILTTSSFDHVILRPPLVFGPLDHTDRLYYWLYQVWKNDPILLPDGGNRKFSCVYVHDLVEAIIESLHLEPHGRVYNTSSYPMFSIREIVELAMKVLGKTPKTVEISPKTLHEKGIQQWSEMPLWIDNDQFTFLNNKWMNDFKMELTPPIVAIQETIHYYQKLNWPEPVFGMPEEQRKALLNIVKR